MGNIIKKGGGTMEASGCKLTIEWGNSLSPVLIKKGWVGGGANDVQEASLESTMGINL